MSRAGEFAVNIAACIALSLALSPARGETLESALVQAYQNNPTLNSQRAATRAIDEGVPQALSGYRPKITVTGSGGEQTSSTTSKTVQAGVGTYSTLSGYNSPASVGSTITQTLYNGFQTANKTRQAESAVLAARATLRLTELVPVEAAPAISMGLVHASGSISTRVARLLAWDETKIRGVRTLRWYAVPPVLATLLCAAAAYGPVLAQTHRITEWLVR